MALVTDISGTYDYEREEAEHAARNILDDIAEEYLEPHNVPATIERTLARWKTTLENVGSFAEFEQHFLAALRVGGAL